MESNIVINYIMIILGVIITIYVLRKADVSESSSLDGCGCMSVYCNGKTLVYELKKSDSESKFRLVSIDYGSKYLRDRVEMSMYGDENKLSETMDRLLKNVNSVYEEYDNLVDNKNYNLKTKVKEAIRKSYNIDVFVEKLNIHSGTINCVLVSVYGKFCMRIQAW